ncbi:S49 family peptidase [Pararhodobacter sp. SW119]|uniref:S49 family peptidase n=1 Tax=Pararhodobacter sp. SW119 TaxID=2780075 RepID=UPI001AE09B61|nr:S49 family peptidase [Pararhodobacter sp. SW119]
MTRAPSPSLTDRLLRRAPRVNLVRLHGMIAAGGRGRLSDATLAPLLERAFRQGRPAAVALSINSPGGSPVQSSLIAARIRRLADETRVPVHAFVEDLAASGGYWIAVAADEIVADRVSILGSIGVIAGGFGAPEALAKLGLERRIYTAGQNKSQLDPFRPENPEDVARLKRLLDQMHGAFIDHVRARRADKLDADADLFTGQFWLGEEAVSLGLADALGHPVPHLKAAYGQKVRIVPYGIRRPFLSRFGLSLAEDALMLAEERAHWARYGM